MTTLRSLPSSCHPFITLALLVCTLLTLPSPLFAAPPTKTYALTPDVDSLRIPLSELGISSLYAISHDHRNGTARHGQVTYDGDDLVYTPEDRFWTIGVDSFTYRPTGMTTDDSAGLVQVVAHQKGEQSILEDFERPEPWPLDIPAQYGPYVDWTFSAAVGDAYGLRVSLTGGATEAWARWRPSVVSAIEGNGTTNGGGTVKVRPPDDDGDDSTGDQAFEGFGDLGPSGSASATILEFGSRTNPGARVRLRQSPRGVTARAEIRDNSGQFYTTSWAQLDNGPHTFELLWWLWKTDQEGNVRPGGMLFRIDGEMRGRVKGLVNDSVGMIAQRIGLMDVTHNSVHAQDLSLAFDDAGIRWGESQRADYELVLSDGFENGNLDHWDTANTNLLEASQEARIDGGWGIETDLGWTSDDFLRDDSPRGGARYGARFLIDTNNVALPYGDEVILLGLYEGGTVPAGDEHTQVRLRQNFLVYEIQLRHRTSSGIVTVGPWQPLASGPQQVAVEWRAADSTKMGNGFARLWIESAVKTELIQLSTGNQTVESVRFGPQDIGVQSHGRLLLDRFESWECSAPDC